MKRRLLFFLALAVLVLQSNKAEAQYSLQNLGTTINTAQSEVSPMISPDGKTLYFSRSLSLEKDGQNRNIYSARLKPDGLWTYPRLLEGALNNEGWNAVCGFTADGQTMLLAGSYMPDGTLKGGFSISTRNETGWNTPIPLSIKGLNYEYETPTATMSPQGDVLIFSTNGQYDKEFHGGFDLYYSLRQEDGSWSKPLNLGAIVNTTAYETAPFLASDGVTLYFSSQRSDSRGGNDLYVSYRLDSTWQNWSEPRNLGVGVNTSGWESYICVSASSDYAYIGSTYASKGKMDIFRVRLKNELRPLADLPVDPTQVAGVIADTETMKKRIKLLVYPDNKVDETTSAADTSATINPITDISQIDTVPEIQPVVEEIVTIDSQVVTIPPDPTLPAIDTLSTEIVKPNTLAEKKTETIEFTPQEAGPEFTTLPESMPSSLNYLTESDLSKSKENLGTSVNSYLSEMAPLISPDGKTLYYSKGIPNDWKNLTRNIWFSTLENDQWSKAQELEGNINTSGWNIVCGLTPDGNTMLLNGKYTPEGKIPGGFSKSFKTAKGWSTPEGLHIDSFPEFEEIQCGTLSPDGKVIVFSSSRKIGEEFYGQMDLYVTFEKDNGNWSIPQNLGKTINTHLYETSPFLAADGRSLYFSSNGHGGYGSNDIFVTRRLDHTWKKWTSPQNLGPAVNSEDWESYFSISASGDYAYVGSRKNTFGMMDLFRIGIKKEFKPDPVVLVSGRVLNQKTNQGVQATVFMGKIYSITEKSTATTDPETGYYQLALPQGQVYEYYAEAPGFFSISNNLDLTRLNSFGEITRDLYLVPMEAGQTFPLNNLFFDKGKASLRPESYPELDRLARILKEYPDLRIEVGGHSQLDHSDPQLSQERANRVKRHFTDAGIDHARISAKGYANTRPINKDDSPQELARNRRVEITILP